MAKIAGVGRLSTERNTTKNRAIKINYCKKTAQRDKSYCKKTAQRDKNYCKKTAQKDKSYCKKTAQKDKNYCKKTAQRKIKLLEQSSP